MYFLRFPSSRSKLYPQALELTDLADQLEVRDTGGGKLHRAQSPPSATTQRVCVIPTASVDSKAVVTSDNECFSALDLITADWAHV